MPFAIQYEERSGLICTRSFATQAERTAFALPRFKSGLIVSASFYEEPQQASSLSGEWERGREMKEAA